MEKAKILITAKFKVLLDYTKRYRIYAFYGGRGGAKTQCLARCMLADLNQTSKKQRILNLREFQNSIEDSTYQVYVDAIQQSGLSPNYTIYTDTIVNNANGSEIVFKGMRGTGGKKSGQQLKSLEGFDKCWVDEAQSFSKEQLDILLPTIRKLGSELWFSFNRLEENDPIWVVVSGGDDDIYLDKVNWYDNPFWTEALEAERLRCLRNHPEDYDHIYEGDPINSADDFNLITRDVVVAAQKRDFPVGDYMYAPKIIGIDPARFGNDTAVWYLRQGVNAKILKEAAKTSAPQLLDISIELIQEHKPAAVFIDRGGEGGSLTDFLRQSGYKNVYDIGFNDASASKRYKNKRAEMYCKLKDWLTVKGCIEDDHDLRQELTNIKQLPKDVIQLEDKADIKKRIGRSPGKADALALTFARDVKAQTVTDRLQTRRNVRQMNTSFIRPVIM